MLDAYELQYCNDTLIRQITQVLDQGMVACGLVNVRWLIWTGTAFALFAVRPPVAAAADPVVVVLSPAPSARFGPSADSWVQRMAGEARRLGLGPVLDPEAQAEAAGGGVTLARVSALRKVQALLVSARNEAAALHEPEALSALARARDLIEAHADVPWAAAWLGEVYTLTGIVAAQSGRAELAEHALSAAATVDPGRGLRAAEAPPQVVERAAAIARATAAGPVGTFEVRTDAAGARVYLDDRPLGRAPATVRAPVGRHVLRIEAPGHLAWGEAFDLLEGQRPPVRVELSPTPAVERARALVEAARVGDFEAMTAALAALDEGGRAWRLWWVAAGPGPRRRALWVACQAAGCSAPRRLDGDAPPGHPTVGAILPPVAVARQVDEARAWLAEPPPAPPPPKPWYARWYTWAATGVAGVAAATAAALLLRPAPRARRRTVIDPGDLGASPP